MLARTPAFLSPRVSGLGRVLHHATKDELRPSTPTRRRRDMSDRGRERPCQEARDPGPGQPPLPGRRRHRRRRQAQDLLRRRRPASCWSRSSRSCSGRSTLGIEFKGGNSFTVPATRRHAGRRPGRGRATTGAEVASAPGGSAAPAASRTRSRRRSSTRTRRPRPTRAATSRTRWPSEFNISTGRRSARRRSAAPGAATITKQALIGAVVFLVLVVDLPDRWCSGSGGWPWRRWPRWSRTCS